MAERPPQEPVNVEAILAEIRRKAREDFHGECDESKVIEDIQFVLDNCRLDQERTISSNRRVLGRLLVWARKLLYAEIRRSIDPALARQSQWNRKAARILRWQQAEIARLRRALGEPPPEHEAELPEKTPSSDSPPLP